MRPVEESLPKEDKTAIVVEDVEREDEEEEDDYADDPYASSVDKLEGS